MKSACKVRYRVDRVASLFSSTKVALNGSNVIVLWLYLTVAVLISIFSYPSWLIWILASETIAQVWGKFYWITTRPIPTRLIKLPTMTNDRNSREPTFHIVQCKRLLLADTLKFHLDVFHSRSLQRLPLLCLVLQLVLFWSNEAATKNFKKKKKHLVSLSWFLLLPCVRNFSKEIMSVMAISSNKFIVLSWICHLLQPANHTQFLFKDYNHNTLKNMDKKKSYVK